MLGDKTTEKIIKNRQKSKYQKIFIISNGIRVKKALAAHQ